MKSDVAIAFVGLYHDYVEPGPVSFLQEDIAECDWTLVSWGDAFVIHAA